MLSRDEHGNAMRPKRCTSRHIDIHQKYNCVAVFYVDTNSCIAGRSSFTTEVLLSRLHYAIDVAPSIDLYNKRNLNATNQKWNTQGKILHVFEMQHSY